MKSFATRILVAIALLMLPSTRLVNAQGILYLVNTTNDTVVIGACETGGAGCSLRGAIGTANNHVGDDGIEVDLPAGSVINLTGALPHITESVSIFGPGPDKLTVRRDTGGNYSIFNVATSAAVSFSGMTISNGSASKGGGINKSSGTVHVSNCTFLGNGAQNGGGISNNGGTLNVINCTFSGNGANADGGGIVINTGTVNVTNSTFSGNIANSGDLNSDGGGGICNGDSISGLAGTLNVTNSTFTGNFAYTGGGISNVANSVSTVTNSTFSGNIVGFSNKGGGIASDSTGPVNVKSSILAGSTGGPSFPNRSDVSGIFFSGGFNIISKSDESTGFAEATDQVGTSVSPIDPKLDPLGLQDNGGATYTIALLPGSPAIDKGTSNGLTGNLTTDQRGTGFPRTRNYPSVTNAAGGDGTDIGAFEFGGPFVPISVSRKMHGAANFDIYLPLSGSPGIECRSGGASGNHQLIMAFPSQVTVSSASVTTGIGGVSSFSVNGVKVTVNLTGVANAQKMVITLFGASNGTNTKNVSIPMGVLLGDTTGNGSVNASDVSLTKSKSGQALGVTNFRTDVTVSNSINSSDVAIVKSRSGTALP